MTLTPISRNSTITPSSAEAARVAQRFTLEVPSDREGEALASLRGLAGTALPDVELRIGKRTPFGLRTTIELVACGSSADLTSLRNLIASAIDPRTPAPIEVDVDAARRLLAIDSPTLPRPVPEQHELGAMELRMRYLMGEYAGPASDVLGRRSAPGMLLQLPTEGDHAI